MEDIISFYPLTADIEAFVVTRGVATDGDTYSSVNMCHYVGDVPGHVRDSRAEVCRRLGIPVANLVVPRQIHSADVAVLIGGPSSPVDVDAVVTGLSDVAIGVSTADCVPVVIADSNSGMIAAAHAGWRGALAGIINNTVAAMVERGAVASDMKALIGPCICRDCFEVGDEVAALFPDKFVDKASGARPHVDLSGYVRDLLIEGGIPASSIQGPVGCTRCNPQIYFSARRLGVASGRIFTGIIRRNNTQLVFNGAK